MTRVRIALQLLTIGACMCFPFSSYYPPAASAQTFSNYQMDSARSIATDEEDIKAINAHLVATDGRVGELEKMVANDRTLLTGVSGDIEIAKYIVGLIAALVGAQLTLTIKSKRLP